MTQYELWKMSYAGWHDQDILVGEYDSRDKAESAMEDMCGGPMNRTPIDFDIRTNNE